MPDVDLEEPPREHILFVCTANQDRSPTAEKLYRRDPRYEVRSAGVAPFAKERLTLDLLLWADRVFVMNERNEGHLTQIRSRFPKAGRPMVDLDVPNEWDRDDRKLVDLLLKRLRPYLGPPQEGP